MLKNYVYIYLHLIKQKLNYCSYEKFTTPTTVGSRCFKNCY
jgi:hypothetical protein